MVIGKEPPVQADVDALAKRASANERVILAGQGDLDLVRRRRRTLEAGRDRLQAGCWTSRNWRTVLALEEMAKA